jgi:hypothetical protein
MDKHDDRMRALPFRQREVADYSERPRVKDDLLGPGLLALACARGDKQ